MSEIAMTGAEALVKTLENAGVERCFTNPGTSEMHAVAAIGRAETMKATLCLFEGVATGAADGYARIAGKPACTLLHLGPGLANGLANLHNAKRARSPIVNIVGDHAVSHRTLDAPLASDIAGFAKPVSQWIKSADTADEVGQAAAEAVAASQNAPGGIATLILPADTAWNPSSTGPAAPIAPTPFAAPADSAVEAARAALAHGESAALLLSDPAMTGEALELAANIAAATGARLYCDTFVGLMARGVGRPFVRRLPYFAEAVEEELKGVRHLVLVSTKAPVAFFAYPGRRGELTPEGAEVVTLAAPGEDALAGLRALAAVVGKGPAPVRALPITPGLPSGPLDPMKVGAIVARHLPEGAIVSDEGATSGAGSFVHTAGAAPHDWLQLTGGSIGQGLPVGVGAATAAPDRKVVCLEGDGSAMYTIQSLWTAARENLDMTVVIFANRSYAILKIEMMRTGAQNPGPATLAMFDLSRPDIGFVDLARGLGVEAVSCETAEQFNSAFSGAMKRRGPFLIEAVMP
ncbi:Putative acetolactate synthase large subunit IlvX [Alphaproteobacteria bacterium SO-S41]|nr:Putative acetolactate synthase large subunit IlvX [Alphaproteobacteria bacterium SO-S41]